jgi:FkbH-like protein
LEKIKLIIWDLDETFWDGTLSEGEIRPIDSRIQLIKELTNRGIMNSIVSKNNSDNAKEKLIELGVWDYFVFPAINWKPKGESVKWVIDSMQLRAVNVLFLDDNHGNLKEVEFYNSGIHVDYPSYCQSILSSPSFIGKDDKIHSRLQQYRVLEAKSEERTGYSSNVDFLRSSEIKIHLGVSTKDNVDRVHELVQRSNQLNFTKLRSSREELRSSIDEEDCYSVTVYDRFGDYGLVGFINIVDKRFKHFVFSCRIMNLGIEQFLYTYFEKPELEIVPDVSSNLNEFDLIDWIDITKFQKTQTKGIDQIEDIKVLFKGGCDMTQMLHSLRGFNYEIEEETNYVEKGITVHAEHTEVLLSDNNQVRDWIPFLPKSAHQTKFFDEGFSFVVYSLLMDYTQYLYINKAGAIIPYGGYENSVSSNDAFNNEFKERFANEFPQILEMDELRLIKNLERLKHKLNSDVKLILINGAEIESPKPSEAGASKKHKLFNTAVESFVKDNENIYLLDVNQYVKNSNQFTDSIRHYKPEVYRAIAKGLNDIISNISGTKLELSVVKALKFRSRNFFAKLKNKLIVK